MRFIPFNWRNPAASIFKEQSYHIDGKEVARLELIDSLPVLSITEQDAYKQGVILADILYEEMFELYNRYYKHLPSLIKWLHFGKSNIHDIDQYINQQMLTINFKFPDKFDLLLSGFVKRLNKWVETHNESHFIQQPLFTIDIAKKLICLPDIFKLSACSAAVRQMSPTQTELIRNLDWPALGVMDKHTIFILEKLHQPSSDKPKAIASITFTPGFLGLSMANNHGLVITMNEATRQETKRHHSQGIPQLILIKEIVSNCSTIQEVRDFLNDNPPATSHILTVMDKNGEGAVFQLLPPNSDKLFTVRVMDSEHIVATNHFLNELGEPIPGTESWPDTIERFIKANEDLLDSLSSFQVLNNVGSPFSIHSMVFTQDHSNKSLFPQLSLQFKKGSTYSACHKKNIHKVNLNTLFSKLDIPTSTKPFSP